jgi:hypothetical protein
VGERFTASDVDAEARTAWLTVLRKFFPSSGSSVQHRAGRLVVTFPSIDIAFGRVQIAPDMPRPVVQVLSIQRGSTSTECGDTCVRIEAARNYWLQVTALTFEECEAVQDCLGFLLQGARNLFEAEGLFITKYDLPSHVRDTRYAIARRDVRVVLKWDISVAEWKYLLNEADQQVCNADGDAILVA